MVGAAPRVLDLCLAHARVRRQGGRPIGGYQAVQHACADMFGDVESARWLVWETAWKLESYAGDAALHLDTVARAMGLHDEVTVRG
jgi:alkylation response protein AidB-like acyl-CoA dehydrogenase